MALYIGNQNTESSEHEPDDFLSATRFQCPQNMTLRSLFAYVYCDTSDQFKLAIYSDNSGYPDALLGETAAISGLGSSQWQSKGLLSPVSLTNGTWYWLGILDDGFDPYSVIYYEDGGVPVDYYDVDFSVNWPTFSDPFNYAGLGYDRELCIYGSDELSPILLDTLTLSGSAESITDLGGTRTIVVDTLALASSAETMTLFAATYISASTPSLAGVAESMTPVGGPISVIVNTSVLTGVAENIGIMTDQAVIVDVLVLAGSAETITILGGTRTIAINVLALASSAETTSVSFVVSVDTVVLASAVITLTPSGGSTSITMSTIALAGLAVLMGPKRDALSTLDLGYLRSDGHEIEIYGSPLIPAEIWTARVNDATITRGERDIIFDGGTGTAFALIEAKQEVWVGTSAGAKDVGRLRVRSITSGDSGVTGTLSVAQYPWWLADDDYLTFWLNYPIRPQFPYLAPDETFYKDKDVTYSDQNEEPTPVVVAGPHRADFLGGGGSTVFNINASESYVMAESATISSYALSMLPSAGATPSINASTGIGTITFTQEGQWWAKYTITDDNGKTQVSYRCYIICSTDPSDPDYPLLSFHNFRLNGSFDQGGWVTSFSAHDDATLSDIPDETLMIIWAKTKYDGTERVITLLPEDVTTIMAGYMTRAVADTDLDSGLQRVDFTVETPEAMLQRFNFSVSLESVEDIPDTWYEYEEWLTIGRSIHHLWRHHSTIFEVADVIGLMDNTDPRAYAEFEAGDLYSMADGFASDRGIRAHVVSDKGGRIHLTYDLQLLTDEEREQYKKVMDITTADRRGNIGVDSRIINEYAFIKTSGFSWDRSFRTDESGNRVPDAEPLCASAPGSIPDDSGSSVYVKDRQTFRDQEHCNNIAGRVFAKQNATYPNVPIAFHGNYMGALDIAYPLWYTMSLQAGDTGRGIVWTGKKLACRTVAIQYDGDQGTALIQANFEAEEPAIKGVPAFCMDVQPNPWGTPVIPPPEEELPDALMTGGSAYYKSPLEQSWSLRSTDSMRDMIQDPFWRDTTGSDSPDDAILWYCGNGYIKRSTDGLQTAAIDVTPSTDPLNDAGDSPAPTAMGMTYSFIEPSWVYNEEFVCIATWQNASSEWRSWLAYTADNGATWSWGSLNAGDIPEIDTFGSLQDIGTYKTGYLTGWNEHNPQKAIAVLSSSKVVFLNDWVDPLGTAESKMQVVAASVSGNTITEGAFYDITSAEWNTPLHSSITEITSSNFLVIYLDYAGGGVYTPTLIAGTVSGTTISLGSKIDFVSEYSSDYEQYWRDSVVCRLTDSLAVVGLVHAGRMVFHLISVSGNGCSFIGTVSNNTGFDCYQSFSMARLTNTKFIVAFQSSLDNDRHVQAMIGTISGGTISLGSIYDATDLLTYTHWKIHCTALTEDRFIISSMVYDYPPDNYQLLDVVQGRVNGTVITFGVGTTAYTNESTMWALRTQNTTRISDEWFLLYVNPNSSAYDSNQFMIGYAPDDPVYNSIWFYNDLVVNTMPDYNHESWNGYCRMLSGNKAILWRIENDDLGENGYIFQGSAYTINITGGPSYKNLATGASIGKATGDKMWVTSCNDSILELLEISLPDLIISDRFDLGSATIAQVLAKAYLAYPLVLFGTDDVLYVYGRMKDPDSLGVSHIIKSITAGVTFTQIVGDWGTNHCGSFLVEADQYMYAIRNTGTGAKLYNGLAAEFTLKSTLPFPHEVAPHGMDLDYYTGAVYACADTGNSIMVAKAMSPWLTWEDMTYDHGTASGVRSILLL